MKREGRQHGMVRTCMILPSPWNPKPNSKIVNKFESPPTAGLFTNVHQKPTNHSKFTGKCGRPRCTGCHMHPCCKSKNKTKGTQKLRSHDVVSNYRLTTWGVINGRPGLNFDGSSATGILDHLVNDDYKHDDDEVYHSADDCDSHGDLMTYCETHPTHEIQEIYDDDDDDDDDTRFCDVGFVLDQVEGDEDWCLVGQM